MEGFSLSWLRREREELRRDRYAFAASLDVIKRRILDSNETELPRSPLLHEWSGTRAVVGSLEMALHAVERTLDEIDKLILSIEVGDMVDLDAPAKKQESGGSN